MEIIYLKRGQRCVVGRRRRWVGRAIKQIDKLMLIRTQTAIVSQRGAIAESCQGSGISGRHGRRRPERGHTPTDDRLRLVP